MSDDYSISKTNQELLAKSEAMKKFYEHARDLLKVSLSMPLGNPALKKVHTNQWLFTKLPKYMDLANWTIIADAFRSNETRYVEYVENRWYIDEVNITVDPNGKSEMKLSLNAFASSRKTYSDNVKEMRKAYQDALKNLNNNNSNSNNNNNNKSNAVNTKNGVINEQWVKDYGVPSIIVDKIKQICSASNSDEDNVRAWFHWMDDNVTWEYYTNHQKSEEQVINDGRGNCVDNSRVFRGGCLALGVKCNFVKNSCISHQYNIVYLNGNGIVVDTGRELASWGSHWGDDGCPEETETSW